jgi:hypothetical protein
MRSKFKEEYCFARNSEPFAIKAEKTSVSEK